MGYIKIQHNRQFRPVLGLYANGELVDTAPIISLVQQRSELCLGKRRSIHPVAVETIALPKMAKAMADR